MAMSSISSGQDTYYTKKELIQTLLASKTPNAEDALWRTLEQADLCTALLLLCDFGTMQRGANVMRTGRMLEIAGRRFPAYADSFLAICRGEDRMLALATARGRAEDIEDRFMISALLCTNDPHEIARLFSTRFQVPSPLEVVVQWVKQKAALLLLECKPGDENLVNRMFELMLSSATFEDMATELSRECNIEGGESALREVYDEVAQQPVFELLRSVLTLLERKGSARAAHSGSAE